MNETEKIFFDKLHSNRLRIADALNEPSVEGVWKGIVDKYSDEAHFVYELLQNAICRRTYKYK